MKRNILSLGLAAGLIVSSLSLQAAQESSGDKAATSQWQHYTTRSKVMSITFEDHYLWLGLSPSAVFPKGGVIRHDLNTVKDFELFNPENTRGGLMSEGV